MRLTTAIALWLRKHRPVILNWFKAKGVISLGAVEGLNTRLKLTVRKSFGFRTLKAKKIARYHPVLCQNNADVI